jgi:hypothetical protein
MPRFSSSPTIASSDIGFDLSSSSTISRSFCCTARWLSTSPESVSVPEPKKRFMSKMPCGVWMYLPDVAPAHCADVDAHFVGDLLHAQGLEVAHALAQKLSLLLHDGARDALDGAVGAGGWRQ